MVALTLSLLLAAVLLASVTKAQAHDTCIKHPREASVVCLKAGHSRIDVCDRDADNHYVYARFYILGGLFEWQDKDGYGGYCGHTTVTPNSISSYNICVQYEGCGTPLYWWQY